MALSDYQAERREVVLGGTSFHVQGLSFQDFATLVRTHLPDMEALFDLFDGIENFGPDDYRKLATAVASQAPGFAANVIALASGETDATEAAARLPFPVTINALLTIGDLTFTEVGGVKKFLEGVAPLLGSKEQMTKMLTKSTRTKAR